MAPKVLVSDKLSETAVQIFRDRGIDVDFQPDLGKDKVGLLKIIDQYDGLAIRSNTKATAKLLAAAGNLKVIGRAGIGVDNVDVPAASKKGVIVMNTPFGNAITTAEHAIAMMMAAARQIPQANASTHSGKWEKSKFLGVELTGKTLGVIGAGNIGSIVIDRALGLKMKVIAYDPFLSEERAGTDHKRSPSSSDPAPGQSRSTRYCPHQSRPESSRSAQPPEISISPISRNGSTHWPAGFAARRPSSSQSHVPPW